MEQRPLLMESHVRDYLVSMFSPESESCPLSGKRYRLFKQRHLQHRIPNVLRERCEISQSRSHCLTEANADEKGKRSSFYHSRHSTNRFLDAVGFVGL